MQPTAARKSTATIAELEPRGLVLAIKAAGLTQQQIADQAGISQATISSLERGTSKGAHSRTYRALLALHAKVAAPKTQAHYAARGRLYRAIVSLPQSLLPHDEPLHERIVIFDGPRENWHGHLHTLLAHAWNTDTIDWCGDGYVYNVTSAYDLTEQNESADIDARLFELSWGMHDGIGYAAPDRVDLFVNPVLKARLLAVLNRLPKRGSAA